MKWNNCLPLYHNVGCQKENLSPLRPRGEPAYLPPPYVSFSGPEFGYIEAMSVSMQGDTSRTSSTQLATTEMEKERKSHKE